MTLITKRKELKLCTILMALSVVLLACQSNSSSQSDSQETQTIMQTMVDYTGSWMTACLMINAQQSTTNFLELVNGQYRSETYTYQGQDCNLLESRIFSLIETGTYTINDTVEVPSGVIAHDVRLLVESRVRNGEPDDISTDQGYSDYMHRDGNTLIRAKGNPVGVAAVQSSEELDFSIVYFLQE